MSHMKVKIKLIHIKICFLFLFSYGIGHAQGSKKLKQREALLKKQIAETKSLLNETKKSEQATLDELTILNQQISYREALTDNLNRQIKQIENDISENKDEISRLTSELSKLKTEFREMIRFAYKQRNKDYNIMYLLSSDNVNQAYRRMKYINQYAENRKLQAKEVTNTQKKLSEKNIELKRNKEDKLLVIDEANQVKKEFIKDKQTHQQTLNKINSNQLELKQKLQKQQLEKDRIAKAIKKAIEDELKKKTDKSNTIADKTDPNPSKPDKFQETPEEKLAGEQFIQNKGKLPWPVEKGSITSRFGRQQHSVVSTTYIENNGIDISTTKNSSVRAVFKGKVTSVLSIPGSGKAIIITHGNYRTVYANLKEVNVKIGQFVQTKQKVGMLLPDGSGTISKAHFEIWSINGSNMKPINPSYWLIKR